MRLQNTVHPAKHDRKGLKVKVPNEIIWTGLGRMTVKGRILGRRELELIIDAIS